MRSIILRKKAAVSNVKLGIIYPTNLIAYDLSLLVDDEFKEPSILSINLAPNARSVGFESDFKDFVHYAAQFEFIQIDGGKDASFLKKFYSKFRLDSCLLRIWNSKADYFEYNVKVELSGNEIRLARVE